MEVTLSEDGVLIFDHLDPFLAEILRQIPQAADPEGDERALHRLLPTPTHADGEEEFIDDWNEFVRPELKQLFGDAMDDVVEDLSRIEYNEERTIARLTIDPDHAESWLNATNQARVVLCERHRFTEKELESDLALSFESRRDLALVQMNFYAMIQEIVLRWTMGELPDDDEAL